MKQIIVLALSVLVSVQSFAAATEDARCGAWGDSLDATQANNRSLWTVKCFPWLKHTMQNGQVILKDTQSGVNAIGYPIFGQVDAAGNTVPVIVPIDPNAPCVDTNTVFFVGYCRAGCFTPDQKILFNGSYVEIEQAKERGLTDILVVDGILPDTSIGLKNRDLVSYTADAEDRAQDILVITTVDGEIKVTKNHPLVDGRGYMVAASTLNVGDSLKTVFNTDSKIVSIETVNYFGKVYNVDMGTSDIFENVIVANDFLSGTVYFQNDGLKELNRQVLRDIIPVETIK